MSKTVIQPNDSFDQWRIKINELQNKMGDLYYLETAVKTDIVSAVNELNEIVTTLDGAFNTLQDDIDDAEIDIVDIQSDLSVLEGKVPFRKDSFHDYGTPPSGATIVLLNELYDTHYIYCPIGTLTLTAADLAVGRSVQLILRRASTCTITFPTYTTFSGNIIPVLSANTDRLLLQKTSSTMIHASIQGLNFS